MKTNRFSLRRRKIKLHNRLIVSYLTACILPLLAACFVIYNFSVRSLEESSLEFSSIFNSQIVTTIDNYIEEYDNITKSALVDNDVITGLRNNDESVGISNRLNNNLMIQKLLMRLKTLKPEIKCIMLMDRNQELYQFPNTGNSVSAPRLAEQPWYRELLRSGDTLVVTPVHSKAYYELEDDGYVVTIGRVIMDVNGISGVLLIDLDPSSLLQLNEDFLIARSTYNIRLTITNQNGELLYDSDVASARDKWKRVLSEGSPVRQKDTGDYLVKSYHTHKGNLTVNTEIPRSKLLFKIGKMNFVAFYAVLACIVVIVTISVIISYSITRPVEDLQRQMKLAEDGEYTVIEKDVPGLEFSSLFSSYNSMITRIRSLIEDVYIAQIRQKNERFLALQTQINPHFLYNTLGSIRYLIRMQENDRADTMVEAMTRFFMIGVSKGREIITVREELEHIRSYLTIQKMRYSEDFDYDIQAEEAILECRMIKLLLQPVVENSLYHGLKSKPGKGILRVTGEAREGRIIFRLFDNGAGMSPERLEQLRASVEQEESEEEPVSYGLRNVHQRIRLHYGPEFGVTVESREQMYTEVTMVMPMVQ